ncbi:MAG: hypothetical protein Kow0056_07510 [Coriobacteriia bacterium]
MKDAFVGMGGNIGAPVANLRAAALAMDALPGSEVLYVSHVYESEPWGVGDQPPFANAVVWLRTTLRADQLLGHLQDIEAALGRERGVRYGPRTIDLDILLFADEEWDTPELVIPHPRMRERDFVLTPLLAIAPNVCWPDGSPIEKSGAQHGRVIADHGRLPDTDPDWYVWEALHSEGPPPADAPWDISGEWVEVGRASAAGGHLAIAESKLRALGIPYELSHRESGDVLGGVLSGPSAILVPAPRAQEARAALAGTPAQALAPGGPTAEPASRYPAWVRGTLKVFSWLFVIYWAARVLSER